MTAWRWLRLDVLLAVHDRQIAEHGGLAGVPNPERIEAALARPQHLAAYGNPDAAALAAAYAFGLAHNMASPMATSGRPGSRRASSLPTMASSCASLPPMPCAPWKLWRPAP